MPEAPVRSPADGMEEPPWPVGKMVYSLCRTVGHRSCPLVQPTPVVG